MPNLNWYWSWKMTSHRFWQQLERPRLSSPQLWFPFTQSFSVLRILFWYFFHYVSAATTELLSFCTDHPPSISEHARWPDKKLVDRCHMSDLFLIGLKYHPYNFSYNKSTQYATLCITMICYLSNFCKDFLSTHTLFFYFCVVYCVYLIL